MAVAIDCLVSSLYHTWYVRPPVDLALAVYYGTVRI